MLMEDKRILRTKAQFRQALITLLDQKRFEQITIKALCDQAGITRITFYAHYADKYELAEDIFREMIVLGTQEYLQLQRKSRYQSQGGCQNHGKNPRQRRSQG